MKLANLNWTCYRIPFRASFHTAHGTFTYRSGALVAISTEDGVTGYGEIAPLPEQSGADLNEVLAALPGLARTMQGRELTELLRFLATASADDQLPAPLVYGLESALLDALGQLRGLRVADLLTHEYAADQQTEPLTPRTRIPVNAIISDATIEAAMTHARAARAQGFTCFKLKLADASQASLERVAAVRSSIGSASRLRLDANASWSFEQARAFLACCAEYDIEYVEQPLPAADLAAMAALRRMTPVPLAADEAMSSLQNARRILEMQAVDVLILKPQLTGGLHICRQIIQEAHAQGVACVITSTLESGIGVTAALHLAAASPEITHPCGLATLDLLASTLLQAPLPIHQGMLTLPPGPGLGVQVDQKALRSFTDTPLVHES